MSTPHPHKPGVEVIDGVDHMRNAKGHLVPLSMVKPADLLVDDFVRRRIVAAEELRKAIAAFRDETFREATTLREILLEQYGATKGGAKGNVSFLTVDGRQRVQVQVADRETFGPQLQAAKALIDECLTEWTADGRAEIRAIVGDAFQVDREGQVNRARILGLRRLNIDDVRWLAAMEAIADARQAHSTAEYARFHTRETPEAPWSAISLDAATA